MQSRVMAFFEIFPHRYPMDKGRVTTQESGSMMGFIHKGMPLNPNCVYMVNCISSFTSVLRVVLKDANIVRPFPHYVTCAYMHLGIDYCFQI